MTLQRVSEAGVYGAKGAAGAMGAAGGTGALAYTGAPMITAIIVGVITVVVGLLLVRGARVRKHQS